MGNLLFAQRQTKWAQREGFCHGFATVRAVANPLSVSGSVVDSIFQFSQIRHQAFERWRFDKKHFPHVPIVASNPRNLIVRRADPKASGFGQIIPRRGLAEKDFLVLYLLPLPAARVRYRILPVFMPVQAGEVVIMAREAGRRRLSRVVDRIKQRAPPP